MRQSIGACPKGMFLTSFHEPKTQHDPILEGNPSLERADSTIVVKKSRAFQIPDIPYHQ
jgi:hypothetical protein